MADSDSLNPLLNEMVSFIQHDLPGLDAGEYQLQINQEVQDSNGTQLNENDMTLQYNFAVTGDRFCLKNPNQSVYSVFPAAGASGEYTTVLPHVVFTKTSLPWLRYPTTDLPYSPPAPGETTDADVPTWLTVLLLDEDDIVNKSMILKPQSGIIRDLFPPGVDSASTLGDNYSYFDGVTDTSALEPGEALTDTIQMIDIPLSLFCKIAPTIDDLKVMAHVREVSLKNKPTMKGISDVGVDTGTFSIVFGNRLPQGNKKSYAYLVALEKLEPFLPTDNAEGEPSDSSMDINKNIRLAVLKSWTFFATAESATFVERVEALNEDTYDNLCLPYRQIGDDKLKDTFKMGYAPMNYQLRSDENTVAWYRGPFLPYRENNPRVELPVSSPDKANIFDPTIGMMDISYSTAWTLGRLMALQNTTFSTNLYNWKKKLSLQLFNLIETAILEKQYYGLKDLPLPEGDEETAEKKAHSKKSTSMIANKKANTKGKFMLRAMLSLKNGKKK